MSRRASRCSRSARRSRADRPAAHERAAGGRRAAGQRRSAARLATRSRSRRDLTFREVMRRGDRASATSSTAWLDARGRRRRGDGASCRARSASTPDETLGSDRRRNLRRPADLPASRMAVGRGALRGRARRTTRSKAAAWPRWPPAASGADRGLSVDLLHGRSSKPRKNIVTKAHSRRSIPSLRSACSRAGTRVRLFARRRAVETRERTARAASPSRTR